MRNSNVSNQLPSEFEDLRPFVDYWAGETMGERKDARATASMDQIRLFYDAMVERADAALDYIEQFPLNEMPQDAECLFRLVLALAQAHVAVELHGSPRAPNTPYPNSIRILKGLSPFG